MEPKDEIKQRLDIVDLISEYIPLKSAGSGNFKGLCPFHGEKTPSFVVSKEKEIWHCFGCDKGGDMFSFVMEIDGMTFPEVLRHLGKKAGVEIPEYKPSKNADEKQVLLGIHELATKFYEAILWKHADGASAREYLKARGITQELAEKFHLGLAPEKWDSLRTFLSQRGFNEKQLLDSGLIKKRRSGDGSIDRFRDRIMIPLCDASGNVLGFTGRIMKAVEGAPKYMNSPETMIYHKSDVLFGFSLAKRAIRQEEAVIIVEGNLDVVASHKAGVEHVVASSGTALTESQLRQLKKSTNRLIFAFDSDDAGFQAAKRGIKLSQTMDLDVRVIQIPEDDGKDPDDVVQKSPERWSEISSSPVHVMEYYFEKALKDHDVMNVDGKRGFAHLILCEINSLTDPVDREHWIQKLSDIINVDIGILRKMLNPASIQPTNKPTSAETSVKVVKKTSRAEKAASFLVGLVFADEESINDILPRLKQEDLPETWQDVYKDLVLLYNQHKSENPAPNTFFSKFQDHLSTTGLEDMKFKLNASVIRAQEEIDGFSRDQVREEITRHLSLLASKSHDAKRKQLEAAIRQAESSGDSDRLKALIEQYTKLLQ